MVWNAAMRYGADAETVRAAHHGCARLDREDHF
jgi:hypothetical protein